jgi:2-haloacid dehalogenase
MLMKGVIKALVFDAYGTLFDVHSVISICNRLFPEGGESLSQMWRLKQLEYTWLRSLMGRYEDFWQVTEEALIFACKALKLRCEQSARTQLMDAYLSLDPYPEVRQSLSSLCDYSLAILSNGSSAMLKAAVESAGLEETFTHVISADDVRIYKPSPRVYHLASQKLSLDQASIGFVSSNSFDVVGAKAFGFWVCWVNRSDTPEDELGLTPDVTVHTLTELADILKH